MGFMLSFVLVGTAAHAASGTCQIYHCYSIITSNGSHSGDESQFHNQELVKSKSEVQVGVHLNNKLRLVAQETSAVFSCVEEA